MTSLPAAADILVAAALLTCSEASRAADACCDLEAEAVQTAKERLRSKARDEQCVDDCKVPVALRGDRSRPADCDRTLLFVPRELGKDE
jgi:hypothetical protein